MIEYTKIEIEDELKKEKDIELQKLDWPMNGAIEYVNATMRYREELPPSIKNLSFKVEAGMKIGIVGRTGSGKSSILQTLFRLVDLDEGYATIDGVRLTEPGLHQLRKHIAFIPQNPFLI
jgi:ABC-type multidrug transport system fused ATPase/permease subunit